MTHTRARYDRTHPAVRTDPVIGLAERARTEHALNRRQRDWSRAVGLFLIALALGIFWALVALALLEVIH